ncbi:GIN domain-containing protein [Flavobacterium magnum]|nr:DUF2807 domain-containing protein [Flavobacterium magnum]
MLKITTTIVLFLIGMLTQAQVSENRAIPDFSRIEVKNGITISYSVDPVPSAKMQSGSNENLSNIMLDVKNGTLKVYTADGNPVNGVTVYLQSAGLSALSASSKAQVVLPQILETRSIDIALSSGAKFTGMIRSRANTTVKVSDNASFNGRVDTGRLSGEFTDSATVVLSGNAYDAFLYTDKNVKVSALNLDTENAVVFASGQSAVRLHAGTNLSLNIADGARVTYSGSPKNVQYSEGALATIKDKSTNGLSAN